MKRCKGNLRPTPPYLTPELVRRILGQIGKPRVVETGGTGPHFIPVVALPKAKPSLRIVKTESPPPAPSCQQANEAEASAGREADARAAVDLPANPEPLELELQLLRIADRRGLAMFEVIRATGRNPRTIKRLASLHGMAFGHRPILAEPLTVRQLLALEDPSRPIPPTQKRHGGRSPARTGWWDEPKKVEAIAIADRRGMAVADLAVVFGVSSATLLERLKKMGLAFGKRPILAEPITLEQLLALADDGIPFPELRTARRKRERQARIDEASRLARKQREAAKVAVAPVSPAVRSIPAARPRPAPPPPARAVPIDHPPHRPAKRLSPIEYAERIAQAKAYLAARHCHVRRANRDDIIPKWEVFGHYGHFSNDELIELAARLGSEACQ